MSGARNVPESLKKQEPARRKSTSRKDRKRWCKGKPGREHDYQVQVRPNDWGMRRDDPCRETTWTVIPDWWICKHAAICQNCGRQESITKQQCPEWKEAA